MKVAKNKILALSCCILAGGIGKRMGAPKFRLHHGGRSFIQMQIDILRRISDDVFVAVKPWMKLEVSGARVIKERYRKTASVFGLLTALKNAGNKRVLVVACDMPFISAGVAKKLFSATYDYDIVVPKYGGKLQMMFAVYSRRIVRIVEARVKRGRYSLKDLAGIVETKVVAFGYAKDAPAFANVNSRSDLEKFGFTVS